MIDLIGRRQLTEMVFCTLCSGEIIFISTGGRLLENRIYKNGELSSIELAHKDCGELYNMENESETWV